MENIPFNIYNRNSVEDKPMEGYNIKFDVFKFIADFSTSGNYISNKKVIWSFGDGTISTSLTSYHSYDYAGYYPVTLTVFLSNGDSTVSNYLSTIKINNLVNDCIVLTTDGTVTQLGGNVSRPIMLTRYNSVNGIDNVNVINLSVSGNRSPFITPDEWYASKDIHLESTARFLVNTINGLTVVDTITTTNDMLYASLNNGSYVLTTSADAINTSVVGTSGYSYFYYVEDYKV